MGRQWLHAKKEITANKRASITTKLVREITVAAKTGVPDPAHNPRLEVAVEAARKQSVSNDVIQVVIEPLGMFVPDFSNFLNDGVCHGGPSINSSGVQMIGAGRWWPLQTRSITGRILAFAKCLQFQVSINSMA